LIGITLFVYTIILLVLFVYSLHSYILIFYYLKFKILTKWFKKRFPKRLTPAFYPVVTVQLPIYNEKYVVHRLVNSVMRLDYPKDRLEVQILDDSDDETSLIAANLANAYVAKGYDIKHIRRGTRRDFKAGALHYGVKMARGDFLAVFDADFVPPVEFLKTLIGEFEADDVAAVQARWGHLNPNDSSLTKSQAISLDNHFVVEQEVKSRANFYINFNGTCGIWRKAAIMDAGGWQGDTLAEDLDLSYRVQLNGWRIVYRGDCVVPGELPDSADSYRIQQNRWAKGTIQVAGKLLSTIMRSDLRPVAKYEAFVHLTCHVNFIAMVFIALLSLPLVYFKVEDMVPDSYFIFASFFTIGIFGYPFLYALSQRESYRGYVKKLPYIAGVIAYSMGLSLSNAKALCDALFKKRNNFTRTPKSGGSSQNYRQDTKFIIPLMEILFGLYMFISLIYVTVNFQLILVPFLMFYSFGFLSLGLSSFKQDSMPVKPQEALCSRENS
jgi:cellulose synthase/poly-beta-1,6-N-acetylglucosamine synthase-like glycosyltransferase